MTTYAAAPTPAKSRGRVWAARAGFLVVLVMPWLLTWTGGFDDAAWTRGFRALVAGLVLGTGVGALLWGSDRTADVGTGLVRGTLASFGTTVAIVYFWAATQSD